MCFSALFLHKKSIDLWLAYAFLHELCEIVLVEELCYIIAIDIRYFYQTDAVVEGIASEIGVALYLFAEAAHLYALRTYSHTVVLFALKLYEGVAVW